MTTAQITVLKPGLETTVQELPGRIGYLGQGFPISGPFDARSFRLANLLVGNRRDTAALECQFLGPKLRFESAGLIAITGADMRPKLDDTPIPMWTTIAIAAGQTLELSAALTGARSYIAVSGGIATPPVLGSRAVFHMAGVGGSALKRDDVLQLGESDAGGTILHVAQERRPMMAANGIWQIEALAGPNDDWLDPASVDTFFAAEWKVQAKSNRTGIRLTGPEFAFSARALDKDDAHGSHPSNIIDHGYPLGAVNLAGQTPIILVFDSPSTGGFINPFTVASAALWKLGQARPGETLRFCRIDRDQAARLRAEFNAMSSPEVLDRV
ncbi:urea carboxylase [Arboricoccus pini]|uniref:Urea carboxylase n=1 Tax=Arboricoccus pini TaxID=1963835 RepID=A0A212Q0F8_9PROT|nr:biotin-dependent carboxyltransferase family protein [Arboricoccus pini]SNB52776.1 urea carboxylase [Arboricoccus pini]